MLSISETTVGIELMRAETDQVLMRDSNRPPKHLPFRSVSRANMACQAYGSVPIPLLPSVYFDTMTGATFAITYQILKLNHDPRRRKWEWARYLRQPGSFFNQ
jgi:hypothetical protein